ncbi:MAG TPA: FecR domain-containing protein [Steroidobacteraceae bacterium]|nr:FecR domain-containing protein [Steroidobacteraceae bacterium]
MRSHQHAGDDESEEARIGLEAAEFLLLLTDDEPDFGDRYPDTAALVQGFLAWVRRSPSHMRIFLETCEVNRRLGHVDPRGLVDVKRLLEDEGKQAAAVRLIRRQELHAVSRIWPNVLWQKVVTTLWIAVLIGAVGLSVFVNISGPQSVSTGVGEQRTCKLDDGSFVVLNTDSRIELEFNEKVRNVHLVRGEVLFMVEHDAKRPFVVRANDAKVIAVGTQFNVRQREGRTEVAVVEGTVQVTPLARESIEPLSAPPPANLSSIPGRGVAANSFSVTAGEKAQVSRGRVSKSTESAANVLAWRQRRLIFYDATLSEVAGEFNRYNHAQIRVEGTAAAQRLTGIFDADRPQSLILYASQEDSLQVSPVDDDWVISGR